MSDNNLTAVFYKQGNVRMEDASIPEPGAGQVQIQIEFVGICGSDLSLWEHGGIPEFLMAESPFSLGHEASGVISKLGEGVTSLKIGDKVALEPLFACGVCIHCKTGRYNVCTKAVICGLPHQGGYMSRYFVQNAELCFRLPSNVSLEEGAMMEPLAVVLHVCHRAGISAGNKVLICGAGPIGLLTILAAKVFGASTVYVTEIRESRIELARKLGADFTLNVSSKGPEEVAEMVEKVLGGKADIAIECSGAAPAIQASVYATKSGGRMVQVGLGEAHVKFPIINASAREVDVLGIMSNTHCTPLAVELVASGKIDLKPIITHKFDLEDVSKAFEFAATRVGGKVLIKCGKS